MRPRVIELDGTTGEGGGQLVRVAVGLAALTGQGVRIVNVRGNRQRGHGGGLRTQHVTSIKWLAEVTEAEVEGLSVGSTSLTFIPKRPPTALTGRSFTITANSPAASAMLILQAILPFILFAADDANEPIILTLNGGTNVSWSLTYEYFDQVLMPTLEERFGIQIERELKRRSWSLGRSSHGLIKLKVHPVAKGDKLSYSPPAKYIYPASYEVKTVHVSMVTPAYSHKSLQDQIILGLGELYPDAGIQFRVTEDSASDGRWNVLLVAESEGGIRWAKDLLWSLPKNFKSPDGFIRKLASTVCRELYKETSFGGQVDEYLQDQLVVFQALCDGYSSFLRGDHPGDAEPEAALSGAMNNLSLSGSRVRKEKTKGPFGHGSMHTQTARWVASELLPAAEFYNKGDFVKGIGFSL